MREELIPVCITNEKFDERFKFMWLNIARDGRLLLCCNLRRLYVSDCHSFCCYLNDVLHIGAFDEFTESALHFVFTYYCISKSGSRWYFKYRDTILYTCSKKDYLLKYIKNYFSVKFNRLE